MDIDFQTMAEAIEQTDFSEMDGKYLTFWMDGQLYGIPIAHVVQIVGMQVVTEVPEFPFYAKGVINLRGSIIPLIDARLRLGKPEIPYDERTCVIVTSIDERSIGIIVDEVDAVIGIPEELISAPPQLTGHSGGYTTGVGKLEHKVVLLLDICKIIGGEALDIQSSTAYI